MKIKLLAHQTQNGGMIKMCLLPYKALSPPSTLYYKYFFPLSLVKNVNVRSQKQQ